MAAAAKLAQAKFNTKQHKIIDHHVVVLCGDGCMQEGVTGEAAAVAGHEKLDNLIVVYDSNDVTLDAAGAASQSEDTAARYRAYGWEVTTVADGHDLAALSSALAAAKRSGAGSVPSHRSGRGRRRRRRPARDDGLGGLAVRDDEGQVGGDMKPCRRPTARASGREQFEAAGHRATDALLPSGLAGARDGRRRSLGQQLLLVRAGRR